MGKKVGIVKAGFQASAGALDGEERTAQR